MVIAFVIYQFYSIIKKGRDLKTEVNFKEKITVPVYNQNNIKTDCDKTIRYCTNDFDCSYLCNTPTFFNIKNTCDSKTKICAPTPITHVAECDSKKGFIDSYVQTELQGFWKCLNTKPYYFNKDQDIYLYVCNNGDVEYDYFNNVPLTCKCNKNDIKVINMNKPQIPMCINEKSLNILSSFVKV